MIRRRRRLRPLKGVALVIVLGILIGACGNSGTGSTSGATTTSPSGGSTSTGGSSTVPVDTTNPSPEMPDKITVLVANQLNATSLSDFRAMERLGEALGIEVVAESVTGADAAIAALLAGQADFVLNGSGTGMTAIAAGQDIKAVAYGPIAPYFTLLTTSDVQDWKDLEGKTIGITATTDSSYYLTYMQLAAHGVDESQVTWVIVRGGGARTGAVRAGKIDAGQVLVEQALDVIEDPESQGRFHRLADVGSDFPEFLYLLYFARGDFIQKYPHIVQALAKAVLEEQCASLDKAYFMEGAVEALSHLADEERLSKTYDALRGMGIWDPNAERWTEEAADFTVQTLVDFQTLREFMPAEQWIDTSFVQSAAAELGSCPKA